MLGSSSAGACRWGHCPTAGTCTFNNNSSRTEHNVSADRLVVCTHTLTYRTQQALGNLSEM